ncbi:hypothetical protein M569_07689 [Genlisea aurea]|uniref:BAG domain-containing protein n=1 Tax=Genlisea aurea TaxID=192259 RepID=S8CK68_9LAMI|nr:hypothetical protein M569_07689 [Genlisea aurea]
MDSRIRPIKKIVQIPVHFVRSEQPEEDRQGKASRIQKVFRGFMVRKCVRKIKEIKSEADAIENRLRERDVVDLIQRETKERVRINESLMSLLLKLDSIAGSEFGVRALRKSVIRKVIALQETVDSLLPVENSGEDVSENTENDMDAVAEEPPICDSGAGEEAMMDSVEMDAVEMDAEGGANRQEEEDVAVAVADEAAEVNNENKRSTEVVVERMAAENAKMMRMMEQMCERSEAQTRMLNALSHRVEMLEKAFVCDRLRRMKKKNHTDTKLF